MSDIRPFQVPAPQDDGGSDPGPGGSSGGQGRRAAPRPEPGGRRPAWPEPPEAPGRSPLPDVPDHRGERYEEHPGEVTEWGGYPAYQEPHSNDPLDLSKPLAPEPVPGDAVWSQEESAWAQESGTWAQESAAWTQEPSWVQEAPSSPYTAPRAPSPRPEWAPPISQPQSGAHPYSAPQRVPAPGQPQPPEPVPGTGLPQTAPPAGGERPFSYWENSGRENEPSFWNQGPQAEQEVRAEREREPRTEEEPAAPPVKKKREPYLDNVKFVLIALVVMGHSLVPTLKADSASAVYLFTYIFHMPAFVLISGYLGRNFWNSNAKINKLVDTLLIPYVVVEIGYALLRFGLGQKWTLTIIDPAWLNWYLVALVLWRISTPIWTRMRQPLLVAVVIYMAAGFSEISGDFSIDRFFGLLPFYVLGLLLKPEHFDLLKPTWVKITSAVVLVGAAGVAIVIAPHVPRDPIFFRYSFKAMDMSWWMGFGVRAAVLVAALVMTAAVLALVPRRETWFSDLGTRTLYAYLLHGVVVVIAKDQGWLSFPWLYGPLGVAAIASSSLALAIVLCLPETRKLFKWLLEPRLVWLYRRPSPAPATTAASVPAAAPKEGSAAPVR